jgi:RNA polymerase sigma-70 factor (ECF subfamily)
MSAKATEIEQLVRAGAARLVARATDAYALSVEQLALRVQSVVEKYLLRDQPLAAPPVVNQFLDALRADDLCLVAACERGDERAWHALMEQYRATVLSAARAHSASEDAAEELAQSVWAELYGLRARADGRPAGKLAYYSGCGSLGGWLRAVVGQLAVDRHRKTARLVQTEEAADFDRLAREDEPAADGFKPVALPDPESAFARAEVADVLQRALARALTELAPEDRLLIKLYYFDDLRLREAGALLGVHEATASRRLTRLHRDVRQRVEALLVSEHGWTKSEAARALSEGATQLDTDLRPLLVAETGVGEQHEELRE